MPGDRNCIHVSYGELLRSATEAVRGLGFVFGQADDAADCFVWTECVFGQGLSLLRQADQLKPAAGWRQIAVTRNESRTVVINAHGCPLLISAARIADLAITVAGLDGHGSCSLEVRGGFGGWAIPYIANRVSGGKYNCQASWILTADEEEPKRIVLQAHDKILELTPHFDPSMDVVDRLFLDISRQPRAAGVKSQIVVPSERLSKALNHGLEVEVESFGVFGRLTARLRVPSSGRSRNQAG